MSTGNKYKYAYIAVVPDPRKTVAGYEHRFLGQTVGYVYWIKAGDTAREEPEQRTKDYAINPDYCILPIRFLDSVTDIQKESKRRMFRQGGQILQPGKVLENSYLSCYQSGGLGQARSSEWHAIRAQNLDEARRLQAKLIELLRNLDPGNERNKRKFSFETVAGALENLVKAFPPPTGIPVAPTDPLNMAIPLVSVVVTPPVDRGFLYGGAESTKYYIRFDTWYTQRNANAYQIARNEYMTEMPDFSYNAVQLKKTLGQSDKDVKVNLEMVDRCSRGLLNLVLYLWFRGAEEGITPTFEQTLPLIAEWMWLILSGANANFLEKDENFEQNGWFYIEIPSGEGGNLLRLALKKFVNEFPELGHKYLPLVVKY